MDDAKSPFETSPLIIANHRDGFTYRCLRWKVTLFEGQGVVVCSWLDMGAPNHTGHKVARFSMETGWIRSYFDEFRNLKKLPCPPVTCQEWTKLTIDIGSDEHEVMCYGLEMALSTFPDDKAIATFNRLWAPIQSAAFSALKLPLNEPDISPSAPPDHH
jgi:hypothetical protein